MTSSNSAWHRGHHQRKILRSIITSVILLSFATACTSQDSSPQDTTTSTGPTVAATAKASDGTTFTGPYASRLASAYDDATTDLQKRVLKDGVITATELSALQDVSIACMNRAGLTDAKYDGLSLRHDITKLGEGASVKIATDCQEKEFGTPVMLLYKDMTQRPNNEPYAASVADCLVRLKLAPQGYTGDDFMRDSENDTLPFDPDSPGLLECNNDPLNAGK